jgi:hypothetical protein
MLSDRRLPGVTKHDHSPQQVVLELALELRFGLRRGADCQVRDRHSITPCEISFGGTMSSSSYTCDILTYLRPATGQSEDAVNTMPTNHSETVIRQIQEERGCAGSGRSSGGPSTKKVIIHTVPL